MFDELLYDSGLLLLFFPVPRWYIFHSLQLPLFPTLSPAPCELFFGISLIIGFADSLLLGLYTYFANCFQFTTRCDINLLCFFFAQSLCDSVQSILVREAQLRDEQGYEIVNTPRAQVISGCPSWCLSWILISYVLPSFLAVRNCPLLEYFLVVAEVVAGDCSGFSVYPW